MITTLKPRTLPVAPLLDMHHPAFAHAYQQGMQWIRFEQQDHHGPLYDNDVIETLISLARTGIFDEEHEPALCEYLGSYFGMIHGAVLSKQGTIEHGVTTLVHLEQQNFIHGYRVGREFFFLDADGEEERTLSDHDVVAQLREYLHDAARSADSDGLLHFCVGGLIGRLSGHLFCWTQEEQHAWEHDCIKELGYVCTISETCLVSLMGVPTLQKAL